MEKDLNQQKPLCSAPGWVHGFALASFGLATFILLVFFLLYWDTDVWNLWFGSELPKDHVFNEAIRPGIFRTNANTWSNLAYVLVGLYICAFAWWDARRKMTTPDACAVRQPALMGLFGLACIVVGFGSAAMHASLMSWGHKFDVFGMFITLVSLIALQWGRWIPELFLAGRRWPTWPAFGLAAVLASILLLVHGRHLWGSINILVACSLLISLGIGLELFFLKRNPQQLRWLVLAGVSLGLAFTIWWLDIAGRFTAPDAWLQGHAIWHLLTATALGCTAQFYRSEIPGKVPPHPRRERFQHANTFT